MNFIELFMWGYQQHYQISVGNTAKELFKKLNDKLFYQVFVLGILVEEKEDRHPICLQPEPKYCGYTPEFFKDITSVANNIMKTHPRKNILHSDPRIQEQNDKMVRLDSMRMAIEQTLNEDGVNREKISFCSMPKKMEGYYVVTIIQFNRGVYERFYRLSKNEDSTKRPVVRNLIDAVANVFLNLCTSALNTPNEGFRYIDRDTDEILRTAGRRLMNTVESGPHGFGGLHNIFDSCHEISLMKYEGEEGNGKLVICNRNHQAINFLVELQNPIELRDKRAVRKLLEISDENKYLISDGELVFGIGEVVGSGTHIDDDLFFIHFTSHLHFELLYKDNYLMKVSYGVPSLPQPMIDSDKFFDAVIRLFSGIVSESVSDLWDLVNAAIKQRHGTMIVVSEGAEMEATRLSKQSTLITPRKITPDLLSVVTSIDGAVILNQDSVCYAIGAILDGVASANGDSSRGARYNSAIRYLDYIQGKYKTLIVIVSEDGFVDIIPDLMPRIDKKLLVSQIHELEKLAEIDINKRDNTFRRDFNQLMGWLEKHEFYLSQEQCNRVNELKSLIDNTLDGMRIVFKELEPNDIMNESYFINNN